MMGQDAVKLEKGTERERGKVGTWGGVCKV